MRTGQLIFGLMAVLVLMATSNWHAGCEFSVYDDYLDLPKVAELDAPEHRAVREALLELELTPETSAEQMMEQIRDLAARAHEQHARVYRALLWLTEVTGKCPKSLIAVIKSMLALRRANPNGQLIQFDRFLDHYARPKFAQCAFWIEQTYANYREADVILSFDRFYSKASATKARGKLKQHEFDELVEGLDLAEARLNVEKMFQVARERLGLFQRLHSMPMDSLTAYMDTNCARLRAYKGFLDTLNIAAALDGRKIIIPAVRRLNEYHRICLAWREPEQHTRIMEHLLDLAYESDSCVRLGLC